MKYLIEDENVSGIYKITNIINNKYYVGSAYLLYKRYREHKSALLRNKHCNNQLSRFVKKYGINSLKFELIEYCKIVDLELREQYYLDLNNKLLMNESKNVKSPNRGKKLSEKHKNNISKALKGYKQSKEHQINKNKALIGKAGIFIRTNEYLDKLKCLKRSEECCTNISKALKGRNNTWTINHNLETKNKIGTKNKINKCNKKEIIKLDLNNNIIKEYRSISDAARDIDINRYLIIRVSINSCLKGKTRTSYGYKWNYK